MAQDKNKNKVKERKSMLNIESYLKQAKRLMNLRKIMHRRKQNCMK